MTNSVLEQSSFLALDVGSKLVGYAFYDVKVGQFGEQGAVSRAQDKALKKCLELLSSFELSLTVIGIPLRAGGEPSEQVKDVLQFSRRLSRRSESELVFIDESHTSQEAASRIPSRSRRETVVEERKKLKKSGALDSLSAVIIGERFLSGVAPKLGLKEVIELATELEDKSN